METVRQEISTQILNSHAIVVHDEPVYGFSWMTDTVIQKNNYRLSRPTALTLRVDGQSYLIVKLVVRPDGSEFYDVRVESGDKAIMKILLARQHTTICQFFGIEPNSPEYDDWLNKILKYL